MDSASCYLGEADDSFECTYPPPTYDCPSYAVPTVEGDEYYVMVRALGDCVDPTGEYVISVDSPSDPALTLEVADAEFFLFEDVDVTATAHLP